MFTVFIRNYLKKKKKRREKFCFRFVLVLSEPLFKTLTNSFLLFRINRITTQIGQRHGGFLGVLQRALARASPHIWFERAEAKDRMAVAKRLKQHVSNPNNPPILIFPEGTCINNTSVMQFKKGSFEVGGVIYPVAIK